MQAARRRGRRTPLHLDEVLALEQLVALRRGDPLPQRICDLRGDARRARLRAVRSPARRWRRRHPLRRARGGQEDRGQADGKRRRKAARLGAWDAIFSACLRCCQCWGLERPKTAQKCGKEPGVLASDRAPQGSARAGRAAAGARGQCDVHAAFDPARPPGCRRERGLSGIAGVGRRGLEVAQRLRAGAGAGNHGAARSRTCRWPCAWGASTSTTRSG